MLEEKNTVIRDFFDKPPTESIFRLYFLSFIIWNKGVLLYVFFGSADMADKLAISNWGKYITFQDLILKYIDSWNSLILYLSFYLFPLLVSIFIYFIVNCKILPLWVKTEEENVFLKYIKIKISFSGIGRESIFYYFKKRHLDKEREFNKERESVLKNQKQNIEAQKQNIKQEQEVIKEEIAGLTLLEDKSKKEEEYYKNIYKNSPKAKKESWTADYLKFRKTTYFKSFYAIIQELYYDVDNEFNIPVTPNAYDGYNRFRPTLSYLNKSLCLNDTKGLTGPYEDEAYKSFTDKGKWFVEMYEFEKNNTTLEYKNLTLDMLNLEKA